MGRPVQATARSVDAIDGRSWPSGVAMGGGGCQRSRRTPLMLSDREDIPRERSRGGRAAGGGPSA